GPVRFCTDRSQSRSRFCTDWSRFRSRFGTDGSRSRFGTDGSRSRSRFGTDGSRSRSRLGTDWSRCRSRFGTDGSRFRFQLLVSFRSWRRRSCLVSRVDGAELPGLDDVTERFQNSRSVPSPPVSDRSILGTTTNILCSTVPIYWV
ncbi:uncharacterized protein DDB_G0287625-like, partial [Coturnix japonica]|uniref:uncharacterized protein DDB_G0287625-like n=1 Tax=Coturnix japonica TaxID=93934 RepID=UPI0013A5DAF9